MDTQQDDNKATECQVIEQLVDAYVSNEIERDAAEKVIRHADVCGSCARVIEDRRRVRTALKRAIDAEAGASDELRANIRAMLDDDATIRTARPSWWYVAAAAALVLFAGGVWTAVRFGGAPGGSAPPSVAGNRHDDVTADVLQVGLAHHVHCVNMVPPPEAPRADAEMQERLGPEYAGLVAAVREHLPGQLTIVDAHRCQSQNRKYLHVIARRGSDIVSFLVTRREEGPLDKADLDAGANEMAITPSSITSGGVSVSAFETPAYYVYVVTGSLTVNTAEIATAIGPPVRDYLATRT